MNRPLEVLIVSQPATYGVAVYVRQLTEAAIEARHHVTVVSPGAARGPLADWVRSAGADHHTLNMARRPAPRDMLDLVRLRRLARGKDVVHLHSSKAGALGRVAALSIGRRRRPAIVVTAHYWSWLVGGQWAPVYRWIERLLARRCDAIVAVSEREALEGDVVLGSSAPLKLILNGVDREHFSPEATSADRDTDVALIVCVGRLSHQKGQDVAIRALALVDDPSARLRLVGAESGEGERDRLEALARSLGVAHRIEWRGAVDDTAPEYRAADVVVAPSRWDGLSLALLEAMACGATIVASDVSGSESLGDAGVIVRPDDPRGLADAIAALLLDPSRRDRLGASARARSGSFDLVSTMRQNLDLWSGLTLGSTGTGVRAPTDPVIDHSGGVEAMDPSVDVMVDPRPGMETPIPYVCMPGSPYTGSTLLGMLLGNHPACASIGAATGLTARVDLSTYLCSCGAKFTDCGFWGRVAQRTVELQHPVTVFEKDFWNTHVRVSKRRSLNGLAVSSLGNAPLDAFRDAVLGKVGPVANKITEAKLASWSLARAVLEVTGKTLFVDTARDHQRPRYLAAMPLLDVKVIHLVRDPRGNVASIMKHTKVGVRKAARQWRHYNVEADRVRRRFPSSSWMLLRYEDLCQAPEATLDRVAEFIGVEPVPIATLVAPSERHVIGNSMRLKALDEINEDLSWQRTLRSADLRTIAKVVGGTSHRLGYDWP